MRFDCIHRALRAQYERLGFLVGRHPVWFILLPLVFSIAMFTAVLKITFIRDLDSIFASPNGRAMRQKRIVDSLYPVNTSYNFVASKFTEKGEFGTLLIMAKDGGSMLREHLYLKALEIDKIIEAITVEGLNYSQLCARYGNKCQQSNKLFNVTTLRDIKNGHYSMKYPVDIHPHTLKYTITGFNIGGVDNDYEGNIRAAKVVRLIYFLDNSDEYKKKLAMRWEELFLETAKDLKFENISIYRLTARCFENEVTKSSMNALPMGIIATVAIFVFCFLICMTNNIVRCKPLIGIFGSTSALIAVGTGFGFVIYCGFQYSDFNTAIPFLMLGIGIDDTFVLLAAWRRTDPSHDVPQRMAQTYSEAAVSITATSVTNFLSFFIGIFAPYPCFHIFCIYAASAVSFTYIYQITFFGGWMVVSGYREKSNLHPFTFKQIKHSPNKYDEGMMNKRLYRHTVKKTDFAECLSRELFGNKIGTILASDKGKVVVLVLYTLYISVAIWGCTQMQDRFKYQDLFPDNSYVSEYLHIHHKYMSQYSHRIHIAITETLDYSDPVTQTKIEGLLSTFESNPYISNFTNCWLRTFLKFSKMDRFCFSFCSFDLTKKVEFIDALKMFLKLPWGKTFADDILFSDDDEDIISSRFIVTAYNVTTDTKKENLLQGVNNIVDHSPIQIASHETWFPLYEQAIMVAKGSIISLSVAFATMTIVFFVFIPHLGYTLCVGLSVLSIEVGVIGYMSLWGVTRNVVSVMCLLMSVGFSVDYLAHMAYAYINSSMTSSKHHIQDALGMVGIAICQGCFSTLLGATILGLVPSAFMRVFFKIIFLVTSFAALHSLFLLPLLLTMSDSCWTRIQSVQKFTVVSQTSRADAVDVENNEDGT